MNLKKFLLFLLLIVMTILGQEKRILMVIAFENFRDEELFVPKNIFEKNGISVDIASIKKGTAIGMLGAKVEVKLILKDIDVKNYDGIIFVGGTGSESLFTNSDAIKLAQEFYKNKKIVSAICLAPGILAKAGILKGKKATCYPSASKILRENGAVYTGKDVEIDGNIITGSGPQVAEKFGNTILQILKK
ncbi:MAG: DJ-1/PfpI/YhbO family deglycase/protease [Candidatus Omnitrophica bacterium]|nr:DJ-1/PfpI/YhbO family deglycase/protease [Candidatus Omnitrophota bacterium]MCM8806702.1 DJ-1/PfpI/YhbO family deglycase/protease [Candidatus Omnitrophota bacterium]